MKKNKWLADMNKGELNLKKSFVLAKKRREWRIGEEADLADQMID